MSRQVSPSTAKPYGIERVTRLWGVARATVYRHRRPDRGERRRLVRTPARRGLAHSLRWPSPWKGLSARSFLIASTRASSVIAPSGPGRLCGVSPDRRRWR